MAEYHISGVWKNPNNVITHYAFHTVGPGSTSRAVKTSKADAIAKVEAPGNTVNTWVWNYVTGKWSIGERVQVVQGQNGKFLRSNPDKQITDNLGHLIDFDWIAP
jgi:hypothetical protein